MGHFRVQKTLTFKMRPSAQPFFVKIIFICTRMKNHFHIKGWALNLVLIQRLGRTRKWPTRRWVSIFFFHPKPVLRANVCKNRSGRGDIILKKNPPKFYNLTDGDYKALNDPVSDCNVCLNPTKTKIMLFSTQSINQSVNQYSNFFSLFLSQEKITDYHFSIFLGI